jgi:hypothetical protein
MATVETRAWGARLACSTSSAENRWGPSLRIPSVGVDGPTCLPPQPSPHGPVDAPTTQRSTVTSPARSGPGVPSWLRQGPKAGGDGDRQLWRSGRAAPCHLCHSIWGATQARLQTAAPIGTPRWAVQCFQRLAGGSLHSKGSLTATARRSSSSRHPRQVNVTMPPRPISKFQSRQESSPRRHPQCRATSRRPSALQRAIGRAMPMRLIRADQSAVGRKNPGNSGQ